MEILNDTNKPCPFCGCTTIYELYDHFFDGVWTEVCPECGAQVKDRTQKAARNKWNSRTLSPKVGNLEIRY